jgi:hypothetical protein
MIGGNQLPNIVSRCARTMYMRCDDVEIPNKWFISKLIVKNILALP